MAKVLIVYYSRTGTTRKVATEMAALGGWDLEGVVDLRPREGLLGYLRSAIDSILDRHTRLAAPRHEPSAYDFVVVGTPVWNGSVSTPIRTWLAQHAGELPPLAFFATEGGRGAPHAFRQMASLAGGVPVATLELAARDVERDSIAPKLAPFLAAVRAAVAAEEGPPPPSPEAPMLH